MTIKVCVKCNLGLFEIGPDGKCCACRLYDEVTEPERLYRISEPGRSDPIHGFSAIPRHHAQMLMMEESSRPLNTLNIGDKARCRFRSSGEVCHYDVVRVV